MEKLKDKNLHDAPLLSPWNIMSRGSHGWISPGQHYVHQWPGPGTCLLDLMADDTHLSVSFWKASWIFQWPFSRLTDKEKKVNPLILVAGKYIKRQVKKNWGGLNFLSYEVSDKVLQIWLGFKLTNLATNVSEVESVGTSKPSTTCWCGISM